MMNVIFEHSENLAKFLVYSLRGILRFTQDDTTH